MYNKNLILLIILLNCLIITVYAKRDFELIFENFTCISKDTKSLLSSYYCGLSKNAKRRTLTQEISFNKNIGRWMLNLLIVLPRKPNDFVLLNLTQMNGCQLLANKNQVTLLQLGRANLDRYSNFPKECPFVSNKEYYIRGYRFDLDLLPAFTLETDMKIWFEYFVDKNPLLEGFIQCRFGLKKNKGNK